MCTALFSIEPGRPTLLVGVRDELVARPWDPPGRHWPEWPDLVGGKDLQAGGTWLAVSAGDRRVSTVLNGRGQAAPAASRQSRGVLPLQAAAGKPLDRLALPRLDPFHLITVDSDQALIQSWDGQRLTERELTPGLYFSVNSGLTGDLLPVGQATGEAQAAPSENGRAHELARIAHFVPRFSGARRPDPQPGQQAAQAWGEWFPLVNGDGIGTDDDRALIVRRELSAGQVWGTTSISLIALSEDGLRYDFTARPGNPDGWYSVIG
jgi:Transport and Golgi organisation 2